MAVRLIRRFGFSAAHLYRRPEWSAEENERRFGKCCRPPGHGHNYRLTVEVAGDPDSETGFVVGLDELDELVRLEVLAFVDHRHLNEALPEFAVGASIPSCENLVLWARDRLATALPAGCRLASVSIFEDDDLGAAWSAADPAA